MFEHFKKDLRKVGPDDLDSLLKKVNTLEEVLNDDIQRQIHDCADALRSALASGAGKQSVMHVVRTKITSLLTGKSGVAISLKTIKQLIDKQQEKTTTWKLIIQQLETKSDFLLLFGELGFQDEEWMNATNMVRARYAGLYMAIRDSNRFSSWREFTKFMGKEKISLIERVANCKSKSDFLELFTSLGIEGDAWEDYTQLTKDGFGSLLFTISKDSRFNNWHSFCKFMGEEGKEFCGKRIKRCITPSDFLALFKDAGIEGDNWKKTEWMRGNGFSGLSKAIRMDNRFVEWKTFLNWMDSLDDGSQDQEIEKLGLEEAVALLGDRPAMLKRYIKLNNAELADNDVDRIVASAFRRLTARKQYDYSDFEPTLGPCEIDSDIPEETHEPMITVTGRAVGADSVMLYGCRQKRIRTQEDGSFRVRVPLRIGEPNVFDLMPVNHEEKRIGPSVTYCVLQTSERDDIQALIDLLDAMGRDALAQIRDDLGRFEYVVQQTEQVLIRKFSKNFEEGRDYIGSLIEKAKSPVVKKVLKRVLDHFRSIDRTKYPNVKKDSPLYFFQKYCVAEIQKRMERGDRGVILANAPGLGKTRTALVAVNGDPATIVAPNSVVSAWGEEAKKSLQNSDMLTLQNMSYLERLALLEETDANHVVTNIEYLRGKPEDTKYRLLGDDRIVVHDEAHALASLSSEQSKGARRLEGNFHLFLTATPFKNPRMMRRMLHNLHPEDVRFSSDQAFSKAFPANDHDALRTLNILKEQHVIRFRKEDVLEEMDPALPLQDQLHRLPRKEQVPQDRYGEFEMTMEQSEAIYELFKDWPKWCKKYDRYMPKDQIAKMDHLRGNQFTFGKVHALRQTANNPEYIGEYGVEDPKAAEMLRTVEACLKEGRKVVIFCQYNAQTLKYAELLARYQPALYTGITSGEKEKKDSEGKKMFFRKHKEDGWELDAKGCPIEDPKGHPMLAMDYERITFQNNKNRKVILATYAAGAVGVTFTAGKAVIFDDLPRDCIEEIQAEDRTHRIDHEHQTHSTVKYVRMVSTYPEEFLKKMKKVWLKPQKNGTYKETTDQAYAKKHDYESAYDLFFEQGTYDQVKLENLQAQKNMFQLINDGITDESVLQEGQKKFVGDLAI